MSRDFVYKQTMYSVHIRIFLCLMCLFLAACGPSDRGLLDFVNPVQESTEPSPHVTGDPEGPIPAPSIPANLEALAKAREEAAKALPVDAPSETDDSGAPPRRASQGSGLLYTLKIVAPENAPELAPAFESVCLLKRLKDHPVNSVSGLNQRLRSDMQTAKEVLHSFGYYAGTARGRARPAAKDDNGEVREYLVTVTFEPGEQYTVGKTSITLKEPAQMPEDEQGRRHKPPQNLDEMGLPAGTPAVADTVLDAAGKVRELFRDRGYPFATVTKTRYTIDHSSKTLDADVFVDSGEQVFMGPLEVVGEQTISYRYLNALRTWRPGRAWDQSRVEQYRDALRNSGLFTSAEIRPGDTALENGQRPVVVELQPAPERTIGGAIKYDSDFGFGVHPHWEHRNLTGNGDRLRVEAPVWQDMQEMFAQYRLPFFLRDDQDLIVRGGVLKEKTDAYNLKSLTASIGLERRINRRWQGTLSVMAEGGDLETPDDPRHKYFMTGFPATLTYTNANSLLDATRGFRLKLAAAPYLGSYDKTFNAVRTRAEGNAYLPLVGKDTLVFALRGVYGLLVGADSQEVPPSIRYYVGGGGSVRGYEYQSLGPRNDSADPLGGSSALEISAETRFKITDTFGVVAFLDGGTAYAGSTPKFDEEIHWGAGLGLRVYTAIGPIRLDIATPLNPRNDDASVQVYFSIGQSF